MRRCKCLLAEDLRPLSNAHPIQRRTVLAAALAGSAATIIAPQTGRARPLKNLRTFVLVHGSWLGGWCWRRVADRLLAIGHRVFTPTMTGVGERAHLLGDAITLETWVRDVTMLIEAEELTDVILVGHSFGGRVVTGVADRLKDRIQQVIFLDSALALSGQSLLDQLPAPARAARIASTQSSGGISIPPPSALSLGVLDAADQVWVDRRMTPQPFGTNAHGISYSGPIGNGLPVSFVEFTEPVYPASERAVAYAKSQKRWKLETLATGHMAMISAPAPLAKLLIRLAG
jgi:pimeloyl-ACP methyl ester carboxylesterase